MMYANACRIHPYRFLSSLCLSLYRFFSLSLYLSPSHIGIDVLFFHGALNQWTYSQYIILHSTNTHFFRQSFSLSISLCCIAISNFLLTVKWFRGYGFLYNFFSVVFTHSIHVSSTVQFHLQPVVKENNYSMELKESKKNAIELRTQM